MKTLAIRNRVLLMTVIFLISFSSLAFSTTLQVGGCLTGVANYSTIGAAITIAPVGATIKVCPGTYAEQLLINKPLTLTGVSNPTTGANNPIIVVPTKGLAVNAHDLFDGSAIAAQILVQTPGGFTGSIDVNISNIAVDGTNNNITTCATDLVGIYYQSAGGTINHVLMRQQLQPSGYTGCQGGLAIFAQAGFSAAIPASIIVENSSVHDFQKNGITVDGNTLTATVSGNYIEGRGPITDNAQNGIQVSDGTGGKVSGNFVSDIVYINPPGCTTATCFSATGILLYDSGGSSAAHLAVSMNQVSNSQGAIVAFGDSSGTADYNDVTSNKIVFTPIAGVYNLDGVDLCSNNNTATANIVMNASGAGVHIDSSCTEMTGSTGNSTTVSKNTVNDACAGVLLGSGTGSSETGDFFYNVVSNTYAGDSCPAGTPHGASKAGVKLLPSPKHN